METKTEVKAEAVKRMKILGVLPNYVRSFAAKKQTVCLFVAFGGYWATASNGHADIENTIKEVEQKVDGIVFAVVQNGQTLSYLYVTDEDINKPMESYPVMGGAYGVKAYVDGKTINAIVRGNWGGLARIA